MNHQNCKHSPDFRDCIKCESDDIGKNKIKTNYKIKSGKYKDFEVLWTSGGQIFPRQGFYLEKSNNGKVRKIIYLEEAFEEIKEETISKMITILKYQI